MLDSKYMVKPSSIGETKVYLGAYVGKVLYVDSSCDWTMISDSYVKLAINKIKKSLREDGLGYNKYISDVNHSPKKPFSSVGYRPEYDTFM